MIEILKQASVIPVLEVSDIATAVPLGQALARGGLRVVELTLRTSCALEALRVMKESSPGLIVGMGTIRTGEDVERACEHGADFLVSPGAGPKLLAALAGAVTPALPGIATASEAMGAYEVGFKALKFFPAEASGGINTLKSFAGPLPDILFCPTGGINAAKAPDYLRLPNVACVGGSWIANKELIKKGDWTQIEQNARTAVSFSS